MVADSDALQIPCVITKISTLAAGGWNITFHIPENEAGQVRPLVGTENKQNFVMFLVKGGIKDANNVTKATKISVKKPRGKQLCQP